MPPTGETVRTAKETESNSKGTFHILSVVEEINSVELQGVHHEPNLKIWFF